MSVKDFIDSYVEYAGSGVVIPELYNRWCSLTALSASIGRKCWIDRGHLQVFPNLYVMLMGEPGTGKGLSCDILQTILLESEYEFFAADRSSKEQFLEDLADKMSFNKATMGDVLGSSWDSELNDESGGASECFILAEEFQDFLGQNNSDFIAFLTKMWSYRGTYKYRIKSGRKVAIPNPTINLLGGTTSSTFALTFPPEIAGQGFLRDLSWSVPIALGLELASQKHQILGNDQILLLS